jgi:two-component system OmpR family response regulator
MNATRILHIDDEPDNRKTVAMFLEPYPEFAVRGCDSGEEGLAVAAQYAPDLILLDVHMPVMDGVTTLAHLRENPRTADIPVIFTIGRTPQLELDRLKSLGAVDVIGKPCDPTTIADLLRGHLRPIDNVAKFGAHLRERLRSDAIVFARSRETLSGDPASPVALAELVACAHKLAGAAGVFGLQSVGCSAAALEESIVDKHTGGGAPGTIAARLDRLIDCVERELSSYP